MQLEGDCLSPLRRLPQTLADLLGPERHSDHRILLWLALESFAFLRGYFFFGRLRLQQPSVSLCRPLLLLLEGVATFLLRLLVTGTEFISAEPFATRTISSHLRLGSLSETFPTG